MLLRGHGIIMEPQGVSDDSQVLSVTLMGGGADGGSGGGEGEIYRGALYAQGR